MDQSILAENSNFDMQLAFFFQSASLLFMHERPDQSLKIGHDHCNFTLNYVQQVLKYLEYAVQLPNIIGIQSRSDTLLFANVF